jgi:hypothetical protein
MKHNFINQKITSLEILIDLLKNFKGYSVDVSEIKTKLKNKKGII